MHKRKDIILNQEQFRKEIIKGLKNEFSQLKRDLKKIDSTNPEIVAGKKSLLQKSQKIKINNEINKFFISSKNIYPAWYAWWDVVNEQVLKLKYIDNL